jgi:hypothetical protein
MVRDHLHDLLDASAPAAPAPDATSMRAMLADARTEARPPSGRRRIAIGSAIGLLFLGGAGVATASSDWLWGGGLENPDRSYAYTAPTWGQCEIRFSALDTHNPLIQAQVDAIIDDWFASADVEAAAEPFVAGYLAQLESDQEGAPDGVTDDRIADLNAWTAHEQALYQALFDELAEHGFATLPGADFHSQVHCDEEDWGGGE